jgi:hypothetical protein
LFCHVGTAKKKAMNRHEQWHLSADAAERYERVVARYILSPWVRVLVVVGWVIAARFRVRS